MAAKYGIRIELERERGGYRISYNSYSPQTRKLKKKSFLYIISSSAKSKQDMIDKSFLKNLFSRILRDKTELVIYNKKPSELRMEMVAQINRMHKSKKKGKYMNQYGYGEKEKEKEESGDNEDKGEGEGEGEGEESAENRGGGGGRGKEMRGGGAEIPPNEMNDPQLPRKSMFAMEEESANTKAFLAPSFSGKTTLMVSELNKLSRTELEEYDKIILFTESTSSAPLQKLSRDVRAKMMIYDRFVPQFVKLLKKINTVTHNKFRFLLLLDDCIDLKGGILIKLILTLRNVNISTVICIQYSKLLSRSQRQSIHDYYLMNMKLEDLEYLMSGFLASHFRDLFIREGGEGSAEAINKLNYKKLAEKAMERLKGKIVHFDQRHDQLIVYHRDSKR